MPFIACLIVWPNMMDMCVLCGGEWGKWVVVVRVADKAAEY